MRFQGLGFRIAGSEMFFLETASPFVFGVSRQYGNILYREDIAIISSKSSIAVFSLGLSLDLRPSTILGFLYTPITGYLRVNPLYGVLSAT